MVQAVKHVNGITLWANVHLLFWLSLIPFSSGWMGENHFGKWPVVVYGFNLVMCAITYSILSNFLVRLHGKESTLSRAIGKGIKGKISIVFYLAGIAICFIHPMIGFGLYVVVAVIWFIPDRRIEVKLEEEHSQQ